MNFVFLYNINEGMLGGVFSKSNFLTFVIIILVLIFGSWFAKNVLKMEAFFLARKLWV